jgi:hypothetical protein
VRRLLDRVLASYINELKIVVQAASHALAP